MVVFFALIIGACAAPRRPELSQPLQIQTSKERLWQTCQQELKDRGFVLERLDLRAGMISTLPLTSRQWFEFWRGDVVSAEAIAESSLQTIQRQVDIEVLPADGDLWQVTCRVAVRGPYSLASRDRDALMVTYALPLRVRSPGKKELQPAQMAWIDLGNDSELEDAILNNIYGKFHGKK